MNHRFIATMATASVSIAGVANAANVNVSADATQRSWLIRSSNVSRRRMTR